MGNFDYEPRFNHQAFIFVTNLHNKDQTIRPRDSVSRHVHQRTRRLSLSLFEGVKLQSRVVTDKAPIVARAAPYLRPVATLHVLAEALRGKLGPVDISAVSAMIEALLDEKIEGVAITAPIIEGEEAGGRVDLSSIDFEKLASDAGYRSAWLDRRCRRPKTCTEMAAGELGMWRGM
jgi:hypothetical protein